jgi:hypothetical protein
MDFVEAQLTWQAVMVAELSVDRVEAPQAIQQTALNEQRAVRRMFRQDIASSG